MPKISIIMPVYNGGNYLRTAIDSILSQTFKDFEFIIIDDGSVDRSVEIVKSYNDKRIKFVQNENNIGIALTMNKGLQLARGEYVARMDCDDISLPKRFAEQVKFMDQHQSIGICGSWVKVIGDNHEYIWKYETDPQKIKICLLFVCSLASPTVIMRRALLVRHDLHFQHLDVVAEDYDLWTRAVQFFDICNIPKVLLLYRIHQNNNTKRVMSEVKNSAQEINRKQIIRLGINPTKEDLEVHSLSCSYNSPKNIEFLSKVSKWFTKLQEANNAKKIYNKEAVASVLGYYWYSSLIRNLALGSEVFKMFKHSPVSSNLTNTQKFKFIVKYLLRFYYYGK